MFFEYAQVGDIYRVKLERISKSETINTKDFGGFNENHKDVVLGENDRDVTGKFLRFQLHNYVFVFCHRL